MGSTISRRKPARAEGIGQASDPEPNRSQGMYDALRWPGTVNRGVNPDTTGQADQSQADTLGAALAD